MTPGSPAVDRPLPPPEAVLIRLVRQAAKVSVAAAAKRAGISTARWTQIEQGYETRDGERRPAWGPPDTLAYMASAIDLPPGRLETEGKRPDAAAVLREMQRPGGDPAAQVIASPSRPDRRPDPDGFTRPHYADPALEAFARILETEPRFAALHQRDIARIIPVVEVTWQMRREQDERAGALPECAGA